MALQLFSNRTWEEDSFNETNVRLVLENARAAMVRLGGGGVCSKCGTYVNNRSFHEARCNGHKDNFKL